MRSHRREVVVDGRSGRLLILATRRRRRRIVSRDPLPDDAPEEAPKGLDPKEITGQGGLLSHLAGR